MSYLLMLLQEAPPEVGINWLHYAVLAINGVLVPLAVELLKPLWAKAPTWLKSFVPLIAGSLFMMLEAYLFTVFGEPIDLSVLAQIFTGGGVGLAATIAFKMGETHAKK